MSQEIQPVKKPRGRPRINPLPIKTESADSVAIDEDDVVVDDSIDEKYVGFDFVPTGNEIKDRAIKSALTEAISLFYNKRRKYKIPQKNWDDICNSANPSGECEKYAISKFVTDPAKVVPVLLAVKKSLTYDRSGLTILKAYEHAKLEDLVKRVTKDETIVEKQVEQVIDEIVTIEPTKEENAVVEVTKVSIADDKTEDVKSVELSTLNLERGQTIFNPDNSSEIYVVGSKGRRKEWVTNLLENPPNDLKSIKILPSNIVVNPDDTTQMFDISKRGRRANWVVEYLKTHKV